MCLNRHEGKLLQFVKDLHSEKLHRDFHNPPPATQPTTAAPVVSDGDSKNKHIPKTSSSNQADVSSNSANQFLKTGSNPSKPPESVFIRLSPSSQRYSFRDEL